MLRLNGLAAVGSGKYTLHINTYVIELAKIPLPGFFRDLKAGAIICTDVLNYTSYKTHRDQPKASEIRIRDCHS
jgi:hypothetical protein